MLSPSTSVNGFLYKISAPFGIFVFVFNIRELEFLLHCGCKREFLLMTFQSLINWWKS